MSSFSITFTKKEAEAVIKALYWINYYRWELEHSQGKTVPPPLTRNDWHDLEEALREMDKWGLS